MKISNITIDNRRAWMLDNGALNLVMLKGGGHIASIMCLEKPGINPLWTPVWTTMEPWQYRADPVSSSKPMIW